MCYFRGCCHNWQLVGLVYYISVRRNLHSFLRFPKLKTTTCLLLGMCLSQLGERDIKQCMPFLPHFGFLLYCKVIGLTFMYAKIIVISATPQAVWVWTAGFSFVALLKLNATVCFCSEYFLYGFACSLFSLLPARSSEYEA